VRTVVGPFLVGPAQIVLGLLPMIPNSYYC
jgi:hypothetical protein